MIVDAWLKSSASDYDWKLVICGNGDLSEFLLEEAKIEDSLIYRGNLSESELTIEVAGANRVLVPSLTFEGFPTMIAMAASLGTPIVFSDNPSLNDLSEFSWCTKIQASEIAWLEYFNEVRYNFDAHDDEEALTWWESNASDSANAQILMLAYKFL
jgi:glycosyltransferase involved in cell wall biosynthesis